MCADGTKAKRVEEGAGKLSSAADKIKSWGESEREENCEIKTNNRPA